MWDSLAEWGISVPSTNNPEEITDQSLVSQQLINALKQLPIEQKTALALAYFQGLTHNEIAEVLGDPLGTVKTRIRLGMQKLRDLLQEDLILWK
jgi:RNA polymerase sigma-70 factor (ECF subfamily)